MMLVCKEACNRLGVGMGAVGRLWHGWCFICGACVVTGGVDVVFVVGKLVWAVQMVYPCGTKHSKDA